MGLEAIERAKEHIDAAHQGHPVSKHLSGDDSWRVKMETHPKYPI